MVDDHAHERPLGRAPPWRLAAGRRPERGEHPWPCLECPPSFHQAFRLRPQPLDLRRDRLQAQGRGQLLTPHSLPARSRLQHGHDPLVVRRQDRRRHPLGPSGHHRPPPHSPPAPRPHTAARPAPRPPSHGHPQDAEVRVPPRRGRPAPARPPPATARPLPGPSSPGPPADRVLTPPATSTSETNGRTTPISPAASRSSCLPSPNQTITFGKRMASDAAWTGLSTPALVANGSDVSRADHPVPPLLRAWSRRLIYSNRWKRATRPRCRAGSGPRQ